MRRQHRRRRPPRALPRRPPWQPRGWRHWRQQAPSLPALSPAPLPPHPRLPPQQSPTPERRGTLNSLQPLSRLCGPALNVPSSHRDVRLFLGARMMRRRQHRRRRPPRALPRRPPWQPRGWRHWRQQAPSLPALSPAPLPPHPRLPPQQSPTPERRGTLNSLQPLSRLCGPALNVPSSHRDAQMRLPACLPRWMRRSQPRRRWSWPSAHLR